MTGLTSDFLQNREKRGRLKSFALLGVGVLVIAGAAVAGFSLYKKMSSDPLAQSGSVVTDKYGDRLPASWLIQHFGTDEIDSEKIGGTRGDPDGDLLTNFQEFYFATDPTNSDTDSDGQLDGIEVVLNLNPRGEGQLYTSDTVSEFSDEFAESNQLDEFTRENLEKSILGLLTSAEPEDVEVLLPPVSELNIISDDSTQAASEYIRQANEASETLNMTEERLQLLFENPNSSDFQIALGLAYETVDKLKQTPTPVAFTNLHQLQIAGFLSAARIFELAAEIDPTLPIDQQSELTQHISYQLQAIQNVGNMMSQEASRLAQRYPEVFSQ